MLEKFTQRIISSLTSKMNWLSFISGLVLVFAYAPFSLWWLPFIVLPLWLSQITKHQGSLAKQGFIFGFAWFASGISWVHVAIDQFGGLPLPVSVTLMLLLCAYLALYPTLCLFLVDKLATRFSLSRQYQLYLLPILWLLTEYLRATLFTGFPWLSFGYSQIDGPLSAFAPVIGERGITFVLLLSSVAIAQLLLRKKVKINVSILALILALTSYLSTKSWVTLSGDTVKVALVQGNIAQSLKWQPDQEWPTMLKYLELTKDHLDADIIVWPESAVPVLEPTAQDYLDLISRTAALNNSALITGIQNYHAATNDYYNGLVVLGKSEPSSSVSGDYYYDHENRYYKNHLLPIGEFVPFGDLLRPLAPLFNLPMSSFSRGDYVQKNLRAKGLDILPLICFEIAFPDQLKANLTADTDMILTVSNDAWFGDSHGPHQHLEIARMRALEFGLPVIRVTNNGITAVIDHTGKVVGEIPQFEEGVLQTELKLTEDTTTALTN